MTLAASTRRTATRHELYQAVVQETVHLIDGVDDVVANLANVAALLRQRFGFFWVGFYFLRGDRLVLGPFQGSPACVYLEKPHGVCWAAVLRESPVVVPDVHQFPGHIACDPESKSEIVVPLRDKSGRIRGVLDVDSDQLAAFDDEDVHGLSRLAEVLAEVWG
ncbi:MAG TPA: GAF domain-containing protein [Bacteroidetes bacterium]|nr:GAF domain-containing protein [Bacteroidota bacterium]